MAKKPDPSLDPSTRSAAWIHMAPKWARMSTLLGGTDAMRSAAGAYLPQHPAETQAAYENRLASATLLNMTDLTLRSLASKPFTRPVEPGDDVPTPVRELLDDVDMLGNDLTTYARLWFKEMLAMGIGHTLVDFSLTSANAGLPGEERTLADDRAEMARPYWLMVRPENVIFAAAEIRDGRERLTHLRITDTVVRRDGFAEVEVPQIRVYEPDRVVVYELRKPRDRRRKEEWQAVEEGDNTLGEVPLVTVYAEREGLMVSRPPLDDLAHLNVRHWQSTADQMNAITVARFPILAVAGAATGGQAVIPVGPRTVLGTRDPNGRYYYVEHSGAALEAGRRELSDLEESMANYGAQFLRRKSGGMVATARALNTAETTSDMQDLALRFQDALGRCLDLTARWLKAGDNGGSVRLDTDFGLNLMETMDLRALLEARRNRDISREAFLNELRRRGLLSDDFEPQTDLAKLMTEETFEPVGGGGRNVTLEDGGNDRTGDEPPNRRSNED